MNIEALVQGTLIWLSGLGIFAISAWFERPPVRSFAKALFWIAALPLVGAGGGVIAACFIIGAAMSDPFWGSNHTLAVLFRVTALLAPHYGSFLLAQLALNKGRKRLGLPSSKLVWLPPTKSTSAAFPNRVGNDRN